VNVSIASPIVLIRHAGVADSRLTVATSGRSASFGSSS
jgi:hypothetical protein